MEEKRIQFRISIIIPTRDSASWRTREIATSVLSSYEGQNHSQCELFHDQLPLAVPCYDLVPVTELTVDRREAGFGYSRLP